MIYKGAQNIFVTPVYRPGVLFEPIDTSLSNFLTVGTIFASMENGLLPFSPEWQVCARG